MGEVYGFTLWTDEADYLKPRNRKEEFRSEVLDEILDRQDKLCAANPEVSIGIGTLYRRGDNGEISEQEGVWLGAQKGDRSILRFCECGNDLGWIPVFVNQSASSSKCYDCETQEAWDSMPNWDDEPTE